MTLPLSTASVSSPEKRAKILEVARKRMMHYGVSKTTMSEIADDAEMAVGTIYLYFKNKDEIVLALAQECRTEQDQFLQSILQDNTMDASQKLQTFFLEKFRYINAFRTETPHGKSLTAYLVQNFPESVNDWEVRFEHAIFTILEQGVAQHAFFIPDLKEASRMLRAATMGFFPLPYLELPKYPREDDLVTLLQWFLAQWRKSS